jgi:hypothetical protein
MRTQTGKPPQTSCLDGAGVWPSGAHRVRRSVAIMPAFCPPIVCAWLAENLVAETRLIPIGGTPMRVLAVSLLSIIALASGDLTGSANEVRYNPPAKIILAECDQSAMQICRQMWNTCSDICQSDSDPDHQQTCWTGCVNRYNHCKIAADCR